MSKGGNIKKWNTGQGTIAQGDGFEGQRISEKEREVW